MTKLLPLLLAGLLHSGHAQSPLRLFPIHDNPLQIQRPSEPSQPFTVIGEHGAILGQQDGVFEEWSFPVKILSHFRIHAELSGYPVPIDVQPYAAAITVSPGLTTITYSHAAFTIRQRMFVPRAGGGAPPIVLFEIDSVRPMRLTFEFRPEMLRMWPAPNFGTPGAEWVDDPGGGFYILHTDDPGFSSAVSMPHARPGILAPYQERPQTWPVQFLLSFDPKTDSGVAFPLLIAPAPVNASQAAARLKDLADSIPRLYAATENYYSHFFDSRLTVHSPDSSFDRALAWAAIAIDQGFVSFHGERGITAGFYPSGDSARPGFGWFFGRDALWTSYAITASGDFPATRDALEFLIRRQRADGKIMHEFSQTADLVDWKATPYFYASADSTVLFVMAMEDYLNASNDEAFLRKHWEAVKHAWAFSRAHDSDGDGIYENTEGTGWVESWPPGMPHQEIYLAALDQQSCDAMSRLASRMGDSALTASASAQAARIRASIESSYFLPQEKFYAFSRNPDGTTDRTATIYPAVAWWSGRFRLEKPAAMLSRWASHEFSTDWGTRDISPFTPFYDPISYHQGTVWPLFTGWVSLAEYRAGRPLSAYAHLMQNAGLTWTQDPGAVTELLSGEFFQPLGRSTSHQIWSSAMVLSPAIRGLFGLDWDAARDTIYVQPHLPASWDNARLENVPLGARKVTIAFERHGQKLAVRTTAGRLCAGRDDANCGAAIEIPLPPVEIEIPGALPQSGDLTSQVKVISEELTARAYVLELEGPGGAAFDYPLRSTPAVRITGARAEGSRLRVEFPSGQGYQKLTIRGEWGNQ